MHIQSPVPSTRVAVACVLLTMLGWVPQGAAQAPAASASDPVLVENSKVQIRKSDYELELLRLPPDIRPGFANNERRVNDLLRRMWGHLPDKVRDQMQASLSEQFLPKYERLIEEYYKRLAEERPGGP